MRLTDYMCQEKKEKKDLPALKIALTYRYIDSKTTLKGAEDDWLQPPKPILTTHVLTERKQPENKNGKKNNSMDF